MTTPVAAEPAALSNRPGGSAALAEANLTPVLGRYFQRSWSQARSSAVGH